MRSKLFTIKIPFPGNTQGEINSGQGKFKIPSDCALELVHPIIAPLRSRKVLYPEGGSKDLYFPGLVPSSNLLHNLSLSSTVSSMFIFPKEDWNPFQKALNCKIIWAGTVTFQLIVELQHLTQCLARDSHLIGFAQWKAVDPFRLWRVVVREETQEPDFLCSNPTSATF